MAHSEVARLKKNIEATKARIAIQRDKLRDLISDAEEIVEHSDSAIEHLEAAADVLSQQL